MSQKFFKRLWVHEVLRVYGDRLVDDTDMSWLVEKLGEVLSNRMNENLDTLFNDFLKNSHGQKVRFSHNS